ncbi:MAG: histidine--tRNA ligase, partial [Candidatus Omnitrophota bacterium]
MIKALRGFNDVLPDEAARWQAIEAASRGVFGLFGYREIRTPIAEETGLFTKTVGEETDIVKKEMFSFKDRGERDMTLRPEGTAPIVRAYLEHDLDKTEPFQRLCYVGPMFRAERPQAGRLRQFSQIGVEAIGSSSPSVDAEVIDIMIKLLDSAGVKKYNLKINNLGCREDKNKLSKSLKDSLSEVAVSKLLCEDCRTRVVSNPLRVLDCKVEGCRMVVRENFKKMEFLCGDCEKHFKEVLGFLGALGIKYTIDPYIVRGLDYYTRTVFEVTSDSLGAQNAIGAGGRYDNLVKDMGGPDMGACGFAIGIERVLLAMGQSQEGAGACAGVFMATLGEAAYLEAFKLADRIRLKGIMCGIDHGARSLKSQMRSADKLGAKFTVIIGDDELKKGAAVLRDMATKEQSEVAFDKLAEELV